MRHVHRMCVALPVVAVALASCVPRSAAQLTVFDPANYQENLLSAARALEQINNQVRQLQAQAQMLSRMDQNLVRLGGTISPDLQRTLARHPNPAAPATASRCACRRRKAATNGCSRARSPPACPAMTSCATPRADGTRSTPACERAALLQGQIADGIDSRQPPAR